MTLILKLHVKLKCVKGIDFACAPDIFYLDFQTVWYYSFSYVESSFNKKLHKKKLITSTTAILRK